MTMKSKNIIIKFFKAKNSYLLTIIKDSYLLLLIPLLYLFTILCAYSGLDALINEIAQLQNEHFSLIWSWLPLYIGGIAPIVVPLIILLKDRDRGLLSIKAVVFSLTVVTILKAITSRVHPEVISITDTYIRSNSFEFGLLINGLASVVEGWPSGHTATNTAMIFSIIFGCSLRIKIAGSIWVVWVVLATIFGDKGGVHWFSDSIAGVVIGVAIALAHISLNARHSNLLQHTEQKHKPLS
ncbi:hypothetical protein N752_05765 [Desulforamulus aquiferis]|nr:hypothetical protein N752_05765 [Desulforamulus aquiferis]